MPQAFSEQLRDITAQRDAAIVDRNECLRHLTVLQDSTDALLASHRVLSKELISSIGQAERATGAGMLGEARATLVAALERLKQEGSWQRM